MILNCLGQQLDIWRCTINSFYHAKSAAHKWGGTWEDYIAIEEFIDSSKQVIGDARHRSLYHHTLGVFLCERIFGKTITIVKKNNSIQVPVREIAERHIMEDLKWIPSPKDYIDGMLAKPWMTGTGKEIETRFDDLFEEKS